MVDAADSKSVGGNIVGVQVPPPAIMRNYAGEEGLIDVVVDWS